MNTAEINLWIEKIISEQVTTQEAHKFRFFGLDATIDVRRRGGSYRERNGKAQLRVHMKGESVWDNLMNRRNRPTKIWKMVGEAAGCGCGCSPAFIMPNLRGFYFEIQVEADPMLEKEDKELPDRVPLLISDSEKDLLQRTPLNV
jgi:hypothetical protein